MYYAQSCTYKYTQCHPHNQLLTYYLSMGKNQVHVLHMYVHVCKYMYNYTRSLSVVGSLFCEEGNV